MKLFQFLTYLILFIFPFGELIRINVGNNIILKPLDGIVAVTFFYWVVFSFITKRHEMLSFFEGFKKSPFANEKRSIFFFLILFPIIGFISLVSNLTWLHPTEFLVSFLYLLRWIAYVFLAMGLLSLQPKYKKFITTVMLVDGALIVLFGYLQYAFYSDLKNLYYLGWDEHMYRMFSVFLDPNFAGAFFVLYFIFVLGRLLPSISAKQKKQVIIYSLVLIATLGAIFLTYSRSALLMFIVSFSTFFILINRKKFIFVALGIIVFFIVSISPFFYIENTNLFRTASSEARLQTAGNAIKLIQDHPILGVGFNAYRYAQIKYGFRDANPKYMSHADAGADNSFLFVFATTGIVGLIFYLGIWFSILKKAFRDKKNIASVVVISSIAGLFVNALFINSLFYAPLLLWMVLIILPLF